MSDDSEPLKPADLTDLRTSIQFALGYDRSGKARGVKLRQNDHVTAEWIVEHLLRSRYVIMQRVPVKPHG